MRRLAIMSMAFLPLRERAIALRGEIPARRSETSHASRISTRRLRPSRDRARYVFTPPPIAKTNAAKNAITTRPPKPTNAKSVKYGTVLPRTTCPYANHAATADGRQLSTPKIGADHGDGPPTPASRKPYETSAIPAAHTSVTALRATPLRTRRHEKIATMTAGTTSAAMTSENTTLLLWGAANMMRYAARAGNISAHETSSGVRKRSNRRNRTRPSLGVTRPHSNAPRARFGVRRSSASREGTQARVVGDHHLVQHRSGAKAEWFCPKARRSRKAAISRGLRVHDASPATEAAQRPEPPNRAGRGRAIFLRSSRQLFRETPAFGRRRRTAEVQLAAPGVGDGSESVRSIVG